MPIVEPEVLMDGDHDIDRCAEVTEFALKTVYRAALLRAGEARRHGAQAEHGGARQEMRRSRPSVAEVAEKTVRVLKECVPAAVPGIAFLSGGQSDRRCDRAARRHEQIGGLPWKVSFSYSRALQAAPQKAWSGKLENVAAAQAAFAHRAR